MLKGIIIFGFMLMSLIGSGQSILDTRINSQHSNKSLLEVLEDIESVYPVRFYFLPEWLEGLSISAGQVGTPLRVVLDEIFMDTQLQYLEMNPSAIVILKDPTLAMQRINTINTASRQLKKISRINLGSVTDQKIKARVSIKGFVRDSNTQDPLIGASIQISGVGKHITGANGAFEFVLPSGNYALTLNYVNYEETLVDLGAFKSGELNLVMEEAPKMLDEIVVMDKATSESTTSKIGQTQITIGELKRKPALLGEVDLIKQLQLQPGVTTAGEAAAGFNVRGGGADQNLVLYDGIPVFNSSHAFGFFSTFNAEAVRLANFYRGGIPAEFGGRVSSVLDITSREGDYQKWSAGGSVGIISSTVFVNGPIVKDKTSLAASIRTTYSDWLINTIRTNYIDLTESSLRFYDGSLKITHRISDNTKLSLSGYASTDWFQLKGDTTYQWQNRLGSFRIDHTFSPRFSATLTVGSGTYGYEVADRDKQTGSRLYYKISYPSAKIDFGYQAGVHKISFGAQSTYYLFNPGTLEPISEQSNITAYQLEKQQSFENAIYIGDEFSMGEKYHIEAGLRASFFAAIGAATVNVYEPGLPRSTSSIIDQVNFKDGEVIQKYYGLEPRFSMRYDLNSNASVKIGYNRIYQYLHLVSNTTAITPVDVWQPSNTFFKPQTANQISIGYFRNFKEKKYEVFVEPFYKRINNILDFKDGADLILNDHIETDLLQGTGEAYGVEMSVSKTLGRLTGSVNYTFSRSFRTISSAFEENRINKGKAYPSNFDQPHIVNVGWKYNLSRRYFFTGNWTYHTGRPVTAPIAGYLVDNIKVADFSERNQYRIPAYHRLDVALVLEGNHKRKKVWDGTWTLSLYNFYARKNPYTIFFEDDGNGFIRPYQLSIIGTVLPSLTYSFKF